MSGSLPCGLVAVGSDGGTGALTTDGLRLSLDGHSWIEIGFRRLDEASVDATVAWRSDRGSFTLALLPRAGNILRVEFGTGLRVVDVRPTTGQDVGPPLTPRRFRLELGPCGSLSLELAEDAAVTLATTPSAPPSPGSPTSWPSLTITPRAMNLVTIHVRPSRGFLIS